MFVVRAPGPVAASPCAGVEVRDVTTVDDVRVLERIAIDGFPIERARRGVSRRGPRRGVRSALVWSRVAEAPDLPAVAFTSNDSRPGLVTLGFLPVTRLTFLVRPPVPA